MGTSHGSQNSSEGPLALLPKASASRLLYSLMIIDALLTRDIADAMATAAAAAVAGEDEVNVFIMFSWIVYVFLPSFVLRVISELTRQRLYTWAGKCSPIDRYAYR